MGCIHSIDVEKRAKSHDIQSASPALVFRKQLLPQSVQFNIVTDRPTNPRIPLSKQSAILLQPPGGETLRTGPDSVSSQRGRASACSYRSYMSYDELAPDSLSVDHLSLVSSDQLSEVFEVNAVMSRYDLSHVSTRDILLDDSTRKQNIRNITRKLQLMTLLQRHLSSCFHALHLVNDLTSKFISNCNGTHCQAC
jgi:hypothetical protein